MKALVFRIGIGVALVISLIVISVNSASRSTPAPDRTVAVTFDDLPSSSSHDVATLRKITEQLLQTFKSNRVPVIGFVNEVKLYQDHSPERIAILKMWLDAGCDLGNHTYSHLRLYNASVEKMKEDVIQGEKVTSQLLAEKNQKLRYFRHPTLNTGKDLTSRLEFEEFLSKRGYAVAPVTIDNSDWIFASVYNQALIKKDKALQKRVADAYAPYMEEMTAFYEQLSRDTLGREVAQTLLVHASPLNADHFGEVIARLRKRGYRFVTLEEALKDPAYRLPDTYVGPIGISWLQRWEISKGGKMRPEPGLPPTMKEFEDAPVSGSDFKTGKK